jgi:hypothetical protein
MQNLTYNQITRLSHIGPEICLIQAADGITGLATLRRQPNGTVNEHPFFTGDEAACQGVLEAIIDAYGKGSDGTRRATYAQ